jgi:hypothetical protein
MNVALEYRIQGKLYSYTVKIPDDYFILGGAGKVNGHMLTNKKVKEGDKCYQPGSDSFITIRPGWSSNGYFLVIRPEENREGHPYTRVFK